MYANVFRNNNNNNNNKGRCEIAVKFTFFIIKKNKYSN